MILIIIHSMIYIVLVTYLYQIAFIKLKNDENTSLFIANKVNTALKTQADEVDKPFKLLFIVLALSKTFLVLGFYIISAVYYDIFPRLGYQSLELNIFGTKAVTLLFLMLGLLSLLIYPFENKKYLVRAFTKKKKGVVELNQDAISFRAFDYRLIHKFSFFLIIIAYPLFILTINQYAYYNDKEIIYKSMFSLKEEAIVYEEITKVDRYFGQNRFNDEVSTVHYEIYYDDQSLDILFPINSSQTLEIHQIIRTLRPDLFETYELTNGEIKFIESKRKEIKLELYQIFE